MRVLIRSLKIVLPLAVVALAGVAAMTMIRNRPVVETQPPRIAPPGVRVHVVTLERVELSVTSEGTVRPRTESQLVPEISGRVIAVSPSFVEGGFFEAGDVLVTIDPFDYRQAVISARSQRAQARLRLAEEEAEAEIAQREWDQLGRGDPRELALRKPQLEDARAAVEAAGANLDRALRDLERAEITAPYAGRVRNKNVDLGQFVKSGDAIATIYAIDVAEIRLPLPDEELAYLNLPLMYRGTENRPGPRVSVRTTFAGQAYTWEGRIVRTESEIDPVSRMVYAVAEVHNPYASASDPNRPPLAVGMYVEAEIQGREFADVAVLPRAALRGRNQVIVVDEESRLRFRDVDILRTTTSSVYITRGLLDGERVALSTIETQTDGMLVQVTDGSTDQLARSAPFSAPAGTEPPDVALVPEAIDARPPQPAWLRELLAERDARPRVADPRPPTPTPPPAPTVSRAPAPTDSDDVTTNAGAEPRMPAETATPTPAVTTAPVPPATHAVAVLPFTNLSQQAADAELGTALTREVSEQLADIDAVTLVPSSADAAWVVGGAVQQLGDMVRVTARVVEAGAGNVVRAVKVDGTVRELSRVRDDVATAVSAGLRQALGIEADIPVSTPVAVAAITVRPFANLSQAPEDDALARAIGQAVAALLASANTLAVVGTEEDAQWLVAGSIQRVGDTVRITARLVDLDSGSVVRAVKVDGPVADVTRLQDEVASAMSNSVREALTAAIADAA